MGFKRIGLLALFTVALTLLAALGGCIGGANALFSGDPSAGIGPAGGTIRVRDWSDPLAGVQIEVPPGALQQPTVIDITEVTLSDLQEMIGWLPDNMTLVAAIRLAADGPAPT